MAFEEFLKSGVGELGKHTIKGGVEQVKRLRTLIQQKLQGNQRAEAALLQMKQEGTPAAFDKVSKYLDLEMTEDTGFASEVRQIAQQIINTSSQSVSTRNYYNSGGSQINIETIQGNARFGGGNYDTIS